ncbi:hypothetical protein MFLAVUS_001796 [Mucor flavus]|uniref:Nudix hydrolase domain-containing protein n=1 Tax=Mucor flavus TaxID=439312 RepID=A0ABP9YNG3_9FUNG
MNKAAIGDIYRPVSAIIVRRYMFNRSPTELSYMLVQKPRKSHAWQFPQGGQDPGETGSEAALRELREECGSDLKVSLVDTTPIGVYQYKFPRKRTDGYIGARVSFFRADYLFGQCQPDEKL